jgi:hypothetical protein
VDDEQIGNIQCYDGTRWRYAFVWDITLEKGVVPKGMAIRGVTPNRSLSLDEISRGENAWDTDRTDLVVRHPWLAMQVPVLFGGGPPPHSSVHSKYRGYTELHQRDCAS